MVQVQAEPLGLLLFGLRAARHLLNYLILCLLLLLFRDVGLVIVRDDVLGLLQLALFLVADLVQRQGVILDHLNLRLRGGLHQEVRARLVSPVRL